MISPYSTPTELRDHIAGLQLQIKDLEADRDRARHTAAANARAHNKVEDERFSLKQENRAMRTLLLRIHSARVAMNEPAVIEALRSVDSFFHEPNRN